MKRIRVIRPRMVVGILAFAAFNAALAAGAQIDLRHHVVASGGGTVTAGPWRLSSSIGEPAAGPTSAGAVTLTSGFLATFADPPEGGQIFRDGFESTSAN
jgi:hypothetical protein